jgi:biopolymer transport protein ExbB/TolQ
MLKRLAIRFTQSIGSVWSVVIHTVLFIAPFCLYFLGAELDKILLILTTIVSLEAIYLSIFIQMSVNYQTRQLQSVQDDIEEIQEDVEEMQEADEGDEEEDEDLNEIKETLNKLMKDVVYLKNQYKNKSK